MINPIRVNAIAGEVVAGAITAGSVWGAVAGGLGIGLAVGADAIADGLSNGTIDNRVEQWLWDKASEWEYGYTQAQVNGQIYKAELTYGDLKALAALLSEAYPEGQIQTNRGFIISSENTDVFPIPLPLDTSIYFTDTSQTGETATSTCLYIYSSGKDYRYITSKYILPSGDMVDSNDSSLVLNANLENKVSNCSLTSDGKIRTNIKTTLSNGSQKESDFYKQFISLSKPLLLSYSLPTFVPGEGVGSASSADIQSLIDSLEEVPYGLTDSDVAVSIPVTGDDVGEDSKPDVRPGVIPSGDELIDDVPVADVEGDFSNFKLPNGLMYVFPFSLPYDFYRGIKLFSASPECPEFTLNFKIPYPSGMGHSGYLVDEQIVLNFGRFEMLAVITRWVSTFGFTMLLIKLSAFILKGGNS